MAWAPCDAKLSLIIIIIIITLLSALLIGETFVVCYIPYVSGLIVLGVFQKWTLEINYIFTVTITLMMSNGVLNPIIYCWRVEDIRSNSIRLLRRMWKNTENQAVA
jgi:hypothetical protein